MPFSLIARRWLPLAAASTIVCALAYLTAQQALRQNANDPQIQLAEDAAAALAGGAPAASVTGTAAVDIGRSLAPFVIVYDQDGRAVAGSGLLGGKLSAPPAGVFEHVRTTGEERVTWQPQRGVRVAAVVVHGAANNSGFFVLAGRSLREVEQREFYMQNVAAGALAATLSITLLIVAISSSLPEPRLL